MVIEWAMYFALGFLSAGLVCLLVMGALWRRAVRLTTRRVAAAIPADVEAARAERDLLSARFARDVRRIELALADARRRHAEERIEVGRGRAALDRMSEARDAEAAKVAEGQAREAALAEELAERDHRLDDRAAEIAARDGRIAELEGSVEAALEACRETERRREEKALEAVTRATEVDTLAIRLEAVETDLAERSERVEALEQAEHRALAIAAQEKDRADRLDRRIERLVADLADREETAERRQRELQRSREALAAAHERISALAGRAEGGPRGDGDPRTIAALQTEIVDLKRRLETAEAGRGGRGGDEAARARLAEEIAGLAAEMVRLTAVVEGRGGAVDRLLAGGRSGAGSPTGLAERIRRLRAEAGGGQGARAERGRGGSTI